MEMPKLEEWDFPSWLVEICDSSKRFDEAERILIEKYEFCIKEASNREAFENLLENLVSVRTAQGIQWNIRDISMLGKSFSQEVMARIQKA